MSPSDRSRNPTAPTGFGMIVRMQVSARGDYAVRAALGLAAAYPATVSAQTLADDQAMPRKFLEAILADLRRADLVRGLRGVDGGDMLTPPPPQTRATPRQRAPHV